MHERRMLVDVLDRVEHVVRRKGARTTGISLRVGAAAATTPEAVRHLAEIMAEARWGYRPVIEVEPDDDPLDPGSRGLTLVSVRLEV